ncbi:MAG: 3-methylmercaptopropionyl-CoA dehydrogenase [Gemmatimonadaceae bacterium]|nr:3-methylmercaptopropionyl-CoA dehydrogenase [Gemmatimonadaceae bacterium]
MPTFRAPVVDYRFLFRELFDVASLASLPGYVNADLDVLLTALEEGGRFCEDVIAPLNMPGDAAGCRWEAGDVKTPEGFPAAYAALADAGWLSLACDPAYGGQGLPFTLRFAIDEMLYAANLSFAMYPGLALGVYEGLYAHAGTALKELYLPRVVSGKWAGTMCLTEAHAGTDLGLIRTAAVPNPDGSCLLTGQKVFISAGEHDLTENILHLVLARLPDAPPGTHGISMFLVPKFVPDANGAPGARNAVFCRSIEHKMGIRGSATCVLDFDRATGWLVGEPHKGLRAMFTLMNAARLGVGLQGLGLAGVSYGNAVAYARERRQGRSLSGVKDPQASADRILHHADIRRGLLWMRAFVEGARALATWTAFQIDVELRHPDSSVREEAADLVALMTPVIKAFFTDGAFVATNIGVQTLGGHGYIRDYGMEQFVRDARIGQIYEGTNYVQALDLAGRKLPDGNGRMLRRYLAIVRAELAEAERDPNLAAMANAFGAAVNRLSRGAMHLATKGIANGDEVGAAASDFLQIFGYVAVGHMWLRQARVASQRRVTGGKMDQRFYDAKIRTARYFFERMLPQTETLLVTLMSGAGNVMDFDDDAW